MGGDNPNRGLFQKVAPTLFFLSSFLNAVKTKTKRKENFGENKKSNKSI